VNAVATVPQPLRDARRRLEDDPRIHLVGGLMWDSDAGSWAFGLDLEVESSDEGLIPRHTRWYFVVDARYPWGSLEIYPAKDGGILRTFAHQDYNGVEVEYRPWRSGDVCVRDFSFALGRAGSDPDPKGEPDRLAWYVEQLAEWVRRASRGELVRAGDPFELPRWRASLETVGYCEDEGSLALWSASPATFGTADLVRLDAAYPLAVRCFLDSTGTPIVTPSWGRQVLGSKATAAGVWIRLPALPVVNGNAPAHSWGEFREAVQPGGIMLDGLLKPALDLIRDQQPEVLLVGFPIPRRVGERPALMHWQPVRLPALSSRKKPRNGFRQSPSGHWKADLQTVLSDRKPIVWLTGRNWHHAQLHSRGQLCGELCDHTVLLLGCGAIGSTVAEYLVRGGVRKLVVADGDTLECGNLVRHSLTIADVGGAKASNTARRLNLLSPHADVVAIDRTYPKLSKADFDTVAHCNVIVDCTAEDDTLHALSDPPRANPADFFSVSVGRAARRLYVYAARATSLPLRDFREQIRPWLQRDVDDAGPAVDAWEGVGCWHPVFPATADRIGAFAAAAVHQIDHWFIGDRQTVLAVLERRDDGSVVRVTDA